MQKVYAVTGTFNGSMNKEFIPYEQALELKELGFNEPCIAYYNFGERLMPIDTDFTNFRELSDDLTKAPLYQQAFRWFREKYNLRITDNYRSAIKKDGEVVIGEGFSIFNSGEISTIDVDGETYEEAELACLKKLIKIAKNK